MASQDDTSVSLRRVFTACQEDSVSIGKSVARFRKIWDAHSEDEEPSKKHFFDRFIYYVRLPLALKERTPYVDRCLEAACRFAASFLKEQQQQQEEDQEQRDEDEDPPDLPPFMHWIFEWLLDHHEVKKGRLIETRVYF